MSTCDGPIAWRERYNAVGERWCSGCREYLPLKRPWEKRGMTFARDKSARGDGLDSYCRECRRYMNRQSYKRHREARKAQARRWAQTHPEHLRAYWRTHKRVHRQERRQADQATVRWAEEAAATL